MSDNEDVVIYIAPPNDKYATDEDDEEEIQDVSKQKP